MQRERERERERLLDRRYFPEGAFTGGETASSFTNRASETRDASVASSILLLRSTPGKMQFAGRKRGEMPRWDPRSQIIAVARAERKEEPIVPSIAGGAPMDFNTFSPVIPSLFPPIPP